MVDAGHCLTLQIHEDESRRVGFLAVQRPAGPVQDVRAQLSWRLLGVGRTAHRSILGGTEKGLGSGGERDRSELRVEIPMAPPGQPLGALTCWFHQCAPTKPAKWPNCSVSTSRAPPAMPHGFPRPHSLCQPTRCCYPIGSAVCGSGLSICVLIGPFP